MNNLKRTEDKARELRKEFREKYNKITKRFNEIRIEIDIMEKSLKN